ncbi:efflux RND transporter permease subunit [Phaeodactylibacter luteus]|uniref:Efflux RND transporter permease subunit n=1 Tax=Phaeodactylibacter luteus TaxID=1564516 RepID=A0A5C6S378_9BACT|nr:efflux RND transporter permease subunit [Phaeodactylibacter luteus]TXB68399.1 efflux RND transporter permease subunit [Phaeodactylibacter luteus]
MRTFTTFILFACLTVIGFALLPLLSVQWLPSGQQSQMSIEYSWPGASPKVLEGEVTSVLEGAFGLVRGVENLYSISRKGTASITLDLKPGVDIDGVRFEIASKIRQIYPSLPAGVSYPQINAHNAEEDALDRPVLLYSRAQTRLSFFWMGPAPANGQVPLCCGARCPLGPNGLATPSQR